MANDNNANEQYLWMNDALGDDDGVGSDGERFSELIADTMANDTNANEQYFWMRDALGDDDGVGSDGERFSELIADTVGGRTRAEHVALQRHAEIDAAQAQYRYIIRFLLQAAQPVTDSARWAAAFSSIRTRAMGSAREIEHHRAGSSTKPLISPFLKARRSHSLSDYPPLYDFSRRPHIRPPSNVRTTPSIPDSVCRSSPTRRSHSLSDYPPLYDFSRRPHIRQGSLGSSYRNAAPDPNFYRRRYINSLLKDIRRNKDLARKLEGRHEELDDACRRDAEELSIIRRERELLVRELELQSREHDMEEYERRRVPPQPILKHSASFPPNGSSSGGCNNTNRVNFASPICTAKEYTPTNSTSGDRVPPPPRVMTGVQPVQQQKQHHQSGSLRSRTVSSPSRDGHASRRSRTPTPAPRVRAADVNREREQVNELRGVCFAHFCLCQEQQRVAHETEFRDVQQRARSITADQRRRATTARRPAGGPPVSRRNAGTNPANASSIFQFVPSH
uniref:Serine/arginine repetitive matrix protein 2 n=1 Tax=Globodera pallida TaxID=36090 RepID=A0A183CC17_GLOPA